MSDEQKNAAAAEAVRKVNATLASYEQLRDVVVMKQEFEKTPKRSIRRFLYTADSLKRING